MHAAFDSRLTELVPLAVTRSDRPLSRRHAGGATNSVKEGAGRTHWVKIRTSRHEFLRSAHISDYNRVRFIA